MNRDGLADAINDNTIANISRNAKKLSDYYFEHGGATPSQIRLLIKADYIKLPSDNAKILRRNLFEAGKNPGPNWSGLGEAAAHHDAPQNFQEQFLSHGFDINDAKYGRFVDNRTSPDRKVPHYSWTSVHVADWEEFWNSKPLDDFTFEEIEGKIFDMMRDPRFPSE